MAIEKGALKDERPSFDKVEAAIEAIRRGDLVLVADDEGPEDKGYLVGAASCATAENVNFMMRYARGLICLPVASEVARRLQLTPVAAPQQGGTRAEPFLVPVDAREGVLTGVSAADRALTARLAASPEAHAEDFVRPGHLFPLEARDGGVLVRASHAEAAVDLARLAGLPPAGLSCDVMNEDGAMAQLPDLLALAGQHRLTFIVLKDLIAWRCRREKLVERRVEVNLPTEYGAFRAHAYRSKLQDDDAHTHVALTMGDVASGEPVLVRVHSECFTGDLLGSLRCDCGPQLHAALSMIEREGRGVLLYMRQEGRGIGLLNKLKAYELQDAGMDTVEANVALGFPPDLREYGTGAQILMDLGLKRIRLMTNNPKKVVGLEGYGLEIVDRVPIVIEPNPYNERYMKTKEHRMGHLLHLL